MRLKWPLAFSLLVSLNLGASVLAGADANLALPKRVEFTTSSGAKITYQYETEAKGLYVQKPGEAAAKLSGDPLTSFPLDLSEIDQVASGKDNKYFSVVEPTQSFFVVATTTGAWVVTNQGLVIQPSIHPVRSLFNVQGVSMPIFHIQSEFSAEGHRFLWINFLEKREDSHTSTGKIFLCRDDGVMVFVGFALYDELKEKKAVIEDGIWSVPNLKRKIDLRNFEAHTNFVPREPRVVLNQYGSAIEDVFAFVNQSFQDLGDQIESKSIPVFLSALSEQDREINESVRINLNQPEVGSAVILGDSGVGKTQILKRFVAAAKGGQFPEIPRTTKFLYFDALSMGQGTSFVSSAESKINAVMEVCALLECKFLIDEIPSLRGGGAHKDNSNDYFSWIKTGMADGRVKIIATATPARFYDAFAGDPELIRRLGPVKKNSPKKIEEVVPYIESWIVTFKKTMPSLELIRRAIELSNEYNAAGAQPAKATQLVSQMYSLMEINGRRNQTPQISDLLAASERVYHLDPVLFDKSMQLQRLESLRQELDDKVIGHDLIKSTLVSLTSQRFAATQDPNRPAIRILIAGSKGVGKTEISKAYANHMRLGDPVVISMNKYESGNASGFRREIAQAIRKNAFAVIILDELDKAHIDVQSTLLEILAEGETTITEKLGASSSGGTQEVLLNFRNASIIGTTNAGQELVLQAAGYGNEVGIKNGIMDSSSLASKKLRTAVVNGGISEFLVDRFQAVLPALPATETEFAQIIRNHIAHVIQEQNERQGLEVTVENPEEFVSFAVKNYFPRGGSNRIVNDLVSAFVREEVTRVMLAAGNFSAHAIRIRFDQKRFLSSALMRANCGKYLEKI